MEGAQKLVKFEQLSEPMEDIEIEPLTGKPYFHSAMLKSHIKSPYQLIPPAKFTAMLPFKMVPVILIRGSRSWEMNYHGNHLSHKRLDPHRWRAFAVDNMLKLGDICLFELISSENTLIKFKVQVLRGDFPSVLLEKEDGTHKNPVVIDDD